MLLLAISIVLTCHSPLPLPYCHALPGPSESRFQLRNQHQQDDESSFTTFNQFTTSLRSKRNKELPRPRRELQESATATAAIMEGSCVGNTLEAGQQRGQGSYLCHPMTNPIYKFGIDSSNQLAYYVNNQLTWMATPPPPETSACIVYGKCSTPLHFFRLQSSGSLAGYDEGRNKVWDSHLDGGMHVENADSGNGSNGNGEDDGVNGDNPNLVSEKQSGSTLEIMEDGSVVIHDEGGVVTWRIDAPAEELELVEVTNKPTMKPTIAPTTKSPTKAPTTKSPTPRPAPPPTSPSPKLGSIRGFLWDDTPTLDALYNSGDVPLAQVSVELYTCSSSSNNSNEELVEQTTTLADGTFALNELEEGRYFVKIVPPTSSSSTTIFNENTTWQFVTKNANGNAIPMAEDSNLNADGTSDCITIGSGESSSTGDIWVLEHLIYGGLVVGEKEAMTVSGTIFWDSNGDGMNNEPTSSTITTTGDSTSPASAVGNIVIDLYSCPPSMEDPQWILLTRTSSTTSTLGEYTFKIPKSNTNSAPGSAAETTSDLSGLLEQKSVSKFRVVVSGGDGYIFSPTSAESVGTDSDVNSAGESPCWDLEVDGKGNVVWNAGITTGTPTSPSTTTATPTTKPSFSTNNPISPSSSLTPTTPTSGLIGGYAFLDANNNGVRDDSNGEVEMALEGVNIRLYSCDPTGGDSNSTSDGSSSSGASGGVSGAASFMSGESTNNGKSNTGVAGDTLLAITKTNNQGLYNFQNLFSGHYKVLVQPPSLYNSLFVDSVGYSISSGSSGVENAVDPTTGSTECFELGGGITDISYNIGLVYADDDNANADNGNDTPSTPVSGDDEEADIFISGMVFEDLNNNGNFDNEESLQSSVIEEAFPNVQVALFACTPSSESAWSVSNVIYDFTTADNNGMYGFDSAQPGGYYVVKFSVPDGYGVSQVWTGAVDEEGKLMNEGVDNTADPTTGSTVCREYRAGEEVYSLDAGFYPLPEGTTAAPGAAPFATSPGATVSPNDSSPTSPNSTPANNPTLSPKPTFDPKGNGTPCSGAPCDISGMCRNKSGLCGSGIGFCNPNSVWEVKCPEQADGDAGEGGGEVPAAPDGGDGAAPAAAIALPTVSPTIPAPSAAPSNSSNPTTSASPSTTPSYSALPTMSKSPSSIPSEVADVCNDDGSVGATATANVTAATPEKTTDNKEQVQPQEITFTYAIQSTTNADGTSSPVDPTMISQFEAELQRRLGCVYFDSPLCLSCDAADADDGRRTRRMALSSRGVHGRMRAGLRASQMTSEMSLSYSRGVHRMIQQTNTTEDVEEESSGMMGLSSLPKDVTDPLQACFDSSAQNCRVMKGQFTAYFPTTMTSKQIQAETIKLLDTVELEMSEMNQDDGGSMLVSYDNEPFSPANSVDRAGGENGNNGGDSGRDGLSTGGIVGIVISIMVLIAITTVASIAFIRKKREQDDAEFAASAQSRSRSTSRDVPFASADRRELSLSQSDDDSDDSSDDDDDSNSSSSSSSSEETNSMLDDEIGSGPSAISGDTGTNVAHARMEDIEDDEDDATTDSSSNSSNDDDKSSGGSYDFEGEEETSETGETATDVIRRMNDNNGGVEDKVLQRLKESAASDETAAVYEDRKHSGEYVAENNNDRHQGYNDHSDNYDGQDGIGYVGQEEYVEDNDQQGYNDRSGNYDGQQYNNAVGQRKDNYNDRGRVAEEDDAGSMNSADPPGTSYRDLPQEEEESWEVHHNGMVMMAAPLQQQQQQMDGGFTNDGFTNDQYLDDSEHGNSFQVYESGESTGTGGGMDQGLNNSYQSLDHGQLSSDEIQSNHDSYHSSNHGGSHHSLGFNEDSNRSYHSEQGSRHSAHSRSSHHSQEGSADGRHSAHSHGSRHSPQGSHHSAHSQQQGAENKQHQQQKEYGQYTVVDDGGNDKFINQDYVLDSNDQNYVDGNNRDYAEGNQDYVEDNYDVDHNLPPPPYNDNKYDQYNIMDGGSSNNMSHGDYVDHNGNNHNNMVTDNGRQYDNEIMVNDGDQYSIDQYGNQYSSTLPGNDHTEGVYHRGEQYHNTNAINHTSFDEESYHSFNPIIPTSSKSQQSRPEELDEEVSVSHSAGSAYTVATHQMSNTSSTLGGGSIGGVLEGGEHREIAGSSGSSSNNASPSASNSQQQETYGEEEESITNIFKSLSEIQNRLASKGKQPPQPSPLPESALMQNDDVMLRNKPRKNPGDVYAAMNYNQPPITDGGGGGGGGWGKEAIVEDASMDGSQVSNFATSAARNRHPEQGQWMEPVDED